MFQIYLGSYYCRDGLQVILGFFFLFFPGLLPSKIQDFQTTMPGKDCEIRVKKEKRKRETRGKGHMDKGKTNKRENGK